VVSIALDAIGGGWGWRWILKVVRPNDGVKVSSLGSSSDGVSGIVVEGLPSIAGDALGSAAGGVESLTEISSATPSLFTWKLNSPKAILKPPVLAETAPARLEMGSMVVAAGVRSAMLGDAMSMMVDSVMLAMVAGGVASMTVGTAMSTMVVDAVSTSMLVLMSKLVVGESMSMPIGGAESTTIADDEPSTLVDVKSLAMVGEGAGESVDPNPVVRTVSAN
jgi:hypothetical protein